MTFKIFNVHVIIMTNVNSNRGCIYYNCTFNDNLSKTIRLNCQKSHTVNITSG